MTALPASGFLSNSARTEQEMKDGFEDLRDVMAETIVGASTTLTIAAGVITPTGHKHTVDTEAAASLDDLDRILQTNHPDGRLLILEAADSARLVVVKHLDGGTGEIDTIAERDILLNKRSMVVLIRQGSKWVQVLESRIGGGGVGCSADFWGSTAPPAAVFMFGQLLDPAQEPELFSELGTKYGGDGVTTFGIPDERGRGSLGRDDMGGTSANRAVNQITGATLGATGGAEEGAITQTQLPNVSFGVTDSGHIHGITDPQHLHGIVDPNHFHDTVAASFTSPVVVAPGGGPQLSSQSIQSDSKVTGITSSNNTTGISVNNNTTGISVASGGTAAVISRLHPAIICNKIMWT